MKHIKKALLTFLSSDPSQAHALKEISRHLKIQSKEDYQGLRDAVDELDRKGIISSDERGRVRYAVVKKESPKKKKPNRLVGRLSTTKRGFGFVALEGTGEEIFISDKFMGTALHGDKVAVALFAKSMGRRHRDESEKAEGEVIEVIERGSTTIVGRLESSRSFFFVVPDNERITRDIYVAKEDAAQAKHGDKVVVQLDVWNDPAQNPEGTIVEVLGKSGDARVEVMSVARSFGLPMDFPAAVHKEAQSFSEIIPADEVHRRVDLRATICVTIDPEDAKDFDDAVSYELLENGNARLGVHIADVSHYVKPGSALDAEALMRGTSVYLVNEVIPMLPERLSNNLCSLRPLLDRLTYSVLMEVTPEGDVVDYEIAKSIIHSSRRFTYEEVQKILDSSRGEFAGILLPLHRLTRRLAQERRKNGSIDFETGEAKFRFDAQGFPSAIIKKVRLDAHRLIEECMLLANKVVAQHIGKVKKEGGEKPFVYRVHDAPDPSRLEDLASFVKQFGYSLPAKHGVTSLQLQKLLDKVKGSEVESVINEVALRSMAKAVYSEKNIGHYGLAFKFYTHFTSPIRRYPDLIVHRLLHEYEKGIHAHRRSELVKSLPAICRQSSERERVATEAERASVKVMQVEYMKRHLGDEFEGVIVGVTNFGMFVEINDLLVQGLIRVRDLLDDYYLFDEKRYQLRGRSRGKVYRLGDNVRVQVVSLNPETREIDFRIVK
ncbi:MAG: ribonuclease R [Ignavibacteriae bacterium]|nr:ribonuclease R [Ignavibacteriota bacterium]